MKVLVIGATGTLGKAIVNELEPRHEIIRVGRTQGDICVDISNQDSIQAMYKQLSHIDAIVMATGSVHFGALNDMSDNDFAIGLNSKLMGQVNVVLSGLSQLNDNGSFTLTSGILNRDPIQFGSSAAMVNGALDGFVKGAALEMPRGLRINIVSPTVLEESLEKYAPYFRGYKAIPAAEAALAYSKSVEGLQTGQVFCCG